MVTRIIARCFVQASFASLTAYELSLDKEYPPTQDIRKRSVLAVLTSDGYPSKRATTHQPAELGMMIANLAPSPPLGVAAVLTGLLLIGAGIGIHVLMEAMVVHVAVSGGFMNFAAGMIAFFGLRKVAHALESYL
jgi:hypothetical protein